MLSRIALVAAMGVAMAFARSGGAPTRVTGAPGDAPEACTQCHSGTLNSGGGSVRIAFPDGNRYRPGERHRLAVHVSDPDQQRWGFELTARLASDTSHGQAGDLEPADAFTQVACDGGGRKPCPADRVVQFITHTSQGTRNGTRGGVTFEFDWTAPVAGAGNVIFYVAANAANGNNSPTGDRIYTSRLEVQAAEAGGGSAPTVQITRYLLDNLVSDVPGLAMKTDPNLVNPWGIALSATGPFWLANNGSGMATVYDGAGDGFPGASPLVVRIPPPPAGQAPATAVGVASNATPAFEIAPGMPARFLFATAGGTISGWNPGVEPAGAVIRVDRSGEGAMYTGLAVGVRNSTPVLYAANFGAGAVEAFDSAFQPLATGGGFRDPNLPEGFAPYNVQRIGPALFVTYARRDETGRAVAPGAGNGLINVFDMDGNLRRRFATGGPLNAPWGLALAPAFFGDYSGALLVGNFGDGSIHAYDIGGGESLGPLTGPEGNPLTIEGLHGLQFGNGRTGGDSQRLYFTAGIGSGGRVGEHGLFGSLRPEGAP